jgi:hypothetical protein
MHSQQLVLLLRLETAKRMLLRKKTMRKKKQQSAERQWREKKMEKKREKKRETMPLSARPEDVAQLVVPVELSTWVDSQRVHEWSQLRFSLHLTPVVHRCLRVRPHRRPRAFVLSPRHSHTAAASLRHAVLSYESGGSLALL